MESPAVAECWSVLLSRRLPPILLFSSVIAYALYFTYATFLRFDAFEARALDLGNFDQTIWNTAHGRWFHLTNQEGIVNRLSLHVEPILIPISGLYWLYSSPKTLLLLQTLVVALGAVPLFLLAQRLLKSRWLALVFGLAFLLNPSIQAANWLEFHAVTLAPTFLLAAFYFMYADRGGFFTLFALLAASCKEEIGLLVMMMGLYAWLVLSRPRLGLITVGISLAWSLFAVMGIQHFWGAGNIHWNRYGYLGESPLQIVVSCFSQPHLIWEQLQRAEALSYLARHLFAVGFLAALAPELVLLSLPSLAINLLADFSPMHQIDTLIYAAPIVPFVMIGGVVGTKRLLTFARKVWPRPVTISLIGCVIMGCALLNHLQHGYTPGSGNYKALAVTEHHRQAAEIIRVIPAAAKVSAQDRLNPHVSQRETVYIFPRVDDADTVLLDVTGPSWPQHPTDVFRQVTELRANGFGVAAAQDGYLLLSRFATTQEMPQAFYSAWHVSAADIADDIQPLDVIFGNLLRLVGIQVITDRNEEVVVRLYWELLAEHERNIDFFIAYLDKEGQPLHSTQFYPPPATLWYPTSLWTVGGSKPGGERFEGVRYYAIRTLPWKLEKDHFTLAVGLFFADEAKDWFAAERLPVTSMEGNYPLLEGGTLLRLGGYERSPTGKWVAQPTKAEGPIQPLDALLDDRILLAGVTPVDTKLRAGEQLRITLHWELNARVERDYSLFFHLINQTGERLVQVDRQPRDQAGVLPTSAWPLNTPILDSIEIDLPATLPPGHYRMLTGFYRWEDGKRLPVIGENGTPENAVDLGTLVVE